MKTCLMLLVAGSMVCGMGQTPAAQSKGVEAPWDVRKMLDGLQAQTGRLKPLLGQMQPEQWVKVGAPYAYVQQKATAANEADYFLTSAKRLAAAEGLSVDAALKRADEVNRARAQFVWEQFRERVDDPRTYDLTINTDHIADVGKIVDLLLEAIDLVGEPAADAP